MSSVKVGLLLSAAICNHITFTSPQPTPSSDELVKIREVSPIEQLFGRIVRSITATTKYIGWAGTLSESAVILASSYPSHPLSKRIFDTLVWGPLNATNQIRIAPVFLAGCGVLAFSAFVRLQCYRALGRHFTFELSLKRDHQLVTAGPYSIVRHPSYTAIMATVVGLTLCHASEGSWVRESGVLDTTGGKLAAYGWLVMAVYSTVSLVARTIQEDKLLKKQFGEQWTVWAKNVPYRLFPGIF